MDEKYKGSNKTDAEEPDTTLALDDSDNDLGDGDDTAGLDSGITTSDSPVADWTSGDSTLGESNSSGLVSSDADSDQVGSGATGSADETGSPVQAIQAKAGPVVDQVREAVKPVVQQAQQKTGELVGQVQQQAVSRLDQQKENLVGGLGNLTESLRQTGEQLRGVEQNAISQYAAQYTETAAAQVEKVSSYLRDKDANQLMGELESFARREPTIFVAGAFLLGLATARFLRASAPTPSGNLASMEPTYNYSSNSASQNRQGSSGD